MIKLLMGQSIFFKKDFTYVIVAITSLLVFLSIAEDVTDKEFWVRYDMAVNFWTATVQNGVFTSFAKLVGAVFDPYILAIVLLIVVGFLWFKDSKRDSLLFSFLTLVSVASIEVVKLLVGRERPTSILIVENGFSFPSGHATMSMILFGLVIYLGLKYLKSRYTRLVVVSISSAMILLIGFSRIYLNAHWLSDVVGGYALGSFLLSVGILLMKNLEIEGYIQRLLSITPI